jgi:hypothetical protein
LSLKAVCRIDANADANANPLLCFLGEAAQRYPPIEACADEDVEDCPWNCAWDIGQGSVVVCIAWSRADELTPIIIALANEHDLLCYHPQQGEVYLPASLPTDPT